MFGNILKDVAGKAIKLAFCTAAASLLVWGGMSSRAEAAPSGSDAPEITAPADSGQAASRTHKRHSHKRHTLTKAEKRALEKERRQQRYAERQRIAKENKARANAFKVLTGKSKEAQGNLGSRVPVSEGLTSPAFVGPESKMVLTPHAPIVPVQIGQLRVTSYENGRPIYSLFPPEERAPATPVAPVRAPETQAASFGAKVWPADAPFGPQSPFAQDQNETLQEHVLQDQQDAQAAFEETLYKNLILAPNTDNNFKIPDFLKKNKGVPFTALFVKQADVERELGRELDKIHQKYAAKISYEFGAKNPACGESDCSGWSLFSYLLAASSVNAKFGYEVFNIAQLRRMMTTSAAYQIEAVGQKTGYLSNEQISKGELPLGTLIGLSKRVPDAFAKGRPGNISHVLVVILGEDGKKYVSECTSWGDGLKRTELKAYIDQHRADKLFCVPPTRLATVPGENARTRYFSASTTIHKIEAARLVAEEKAAAQKAAQQQVKPIVQVERSINISDLVDAWKEMMAPQCADTGSSSAQKTAAYVASEKTQATPICPVASLTRVDEGNRMCATLSL